MSQTRKSNLHRVDGFTQLCAAALIDAACINPDISKIQSSFSNFCAAIYDFSIPSTLNDRFPRRTHVFEQYLIIAPRMGQDCISGNAAWRKSFQCNRMDVKQSHLRISGQVSFTHQLCRAQSWIPSFFVVDLVCKVQITSISISFRQYTHTETSATSSCDQYSRLA